MFWSWNGAGCLSYHLVLSKFLGHKIWVSLLYFGSIVVNKQLQCLNNRVNMLYIHSLKVAFSIPFPSFFFLSSVSDFFSFILNSVTSELVWEFCQRHHWNRVFQTSFPIGTSNKMFKLHWQFYLSFIVIICPRNTHLLPCHHLALFFSCCSGVDWPNIGEIAIVVTTNILPRNSKTLIILDIRKIRS